jgi:hypothetical protein
MTGRQEYDRTKDRQRTLDKYMINFMSLLGLQKSSIENMQLSGIPIPNVLLFTCMAKVSWLYRTT